MIPSTYLDKLLSNNPVFIFWYPINFQSIFITTFPIDLNLIKGKIKVFCTAMGSLRNPMLTHLQSLNFRKKD